CRAGSQLSTCLSNLVLQLFDARLAQHERTGSHAILIHARTCQSPAAARIDREIKIQQFVIPLTPRLTMCPKTLLVIQWRSARLPRFRFATTTTPSSKASSCASSNTTRVLSDSCTKISPAPKAAQLS